MPEEPYQSLYRRYRPGRFSEVIGQDHVTRALCNAVASDRIGHAYLFSGPRGTGKTSTARILAKALNCASPSQGEPCGSCDSCQAIASGSSLDVHELDAASNNGVDAMRDLVARAALATPGRWKVYIIDEVHMLSNAASNALLKTLEEPPGQVIFVLATTDPQKVLPTIRSRTQHFEFHLLDAGQLSDLVARVAKDASLDVGDDVLPSVVRKARGSARDALSALDQASAAGLLDDSGPLVDRLVTTVLERDTGGALSALDAAVSAGRDPAVVAAETVERLRQVFLGTFAPDLTDGDTASPPEGAGLAALVRSMEVIGQAQVEMRSSPDPRVTLEVALVRLTRPEVDASPEALLERIERLERGGPPSPGPGPGRPVPPPPPAPKSAPRTPAPRAKPSSSGRTAAAPAGTAAKTLTERYGPSATGGTGPGRDEITKAWGDGILASLSTRARARFKMGRWVPGEAGTATFALPNDAYRSYCEDLRGEVQAALSAHFGLAVELVLIVDPDAGALTAIIGNASPGGGSPRNGSSRNGTSRRPVVPSEAIEDPATFIAEDELRAQAAALVLEHFPGAVEITGAT